MTYNDIFINQTVPRVLENVAHVNY